MKRALAFALLCLIGCNRAPPPRQTADPSVPAHTFRERFVGRWQAPDTSVVVIEDRDGSVVIEPPVSLDWDNVINNVRWEGNRLCFDIYQYGKAKENIKGYDGARNEVVLTTTDDPDRLTRSVRGERSGDPTIEELKRFEDVPTVMQKDAASRVIAADEPQHDVVKKDTQKDPASRVIAADEPQDDAVKKELEKLQGTWVWLATEVKGGQDNSEVFLKLTKASGNATFTVKGNKWTREWETLEGMPFSYPGTVTIDPTMTPKKIDFTFDGKKMIGIYELNGDTLRLAWGAFGAVDVDERERPKELKYAEDNKFLIYIYERLK